MPTWLEPLDLPRGDSDAAYAAADACRSLANVLVRACDARAAEAERAGAAWQGAHHDLFGRRLGALHAEAEQLVIRLRRAADAIERAVWHAEYERRRRAETKGEAAAAGGAAGAAKAGATGGAKGGAKGGG